MAKKIKPFGLRAVSIADDCGNEIKLCGQTFSFTPSITTTEIKCNDRKQVRTCLDGMEVTVESVGFDLEAYALMTGAEIVESTTATGETNYHIVQKSGDCFPHFSVYGKAIGENGESDMHVRLFSVVITSIEGSFTQDEFFVQSMTGMAEDRGEGIYEIVVHEGSPDINPIPLPEYLMPVNRYDLQAGCDDLDPSGSVASLKDLSGYNRALVASGVANEPEYDSSVPALVFDGVDDSMVADLTSPPTIPKPFTAVFVIQMDNAVNATGISLGAGADRISVINNELVWEGLALSPGLINDEEWHVHVIVDDGVNAKWFVDGSEYYTQATSGAASVASLTVGANELLVNHASMMYGESRIFDRDLSDNEITGLSTSLMDKWGI